jgi:hypothetical protein
MRTRIAALAALALAAAPGAARAEEAEEVEVTAGVVTGLSCALAARTTGDLTRLTSCPPGEAAKALVVYDVAERRIYSISPKKVFRWELERAFGGGSIDFSGTTLKVDPKSEVATVEVAEFSITPRPKPGAFKGCL